MASLSDGLGFEELATSGLQSTISPYFTGSVTTASILAGGQITTTGSVTATGILKTSASAVVAGSVVSTGIVIGASKTLSPAGAGSPTTWGLGVQAGSSIFSNAAVVVNFGTAFSAAPAVTTSLQASGADVGYVGGVAAGSFTAFGTSGIAFSWTAVGPL